ncbi:hypothetical protein IMSAGC004_01961 [Bacteroidaceae bacterium]|uniref:IS630 family transposase n=2 Tax=Bacteroidales TaxID=171549 RepID=UPI001434767C|nr:MULTISPECIES: IS630 family transposase [Bacteroidales]GFH99557.1 hypothetical protein IMSAGC004_01961 [Bacteroidaceae bacterium]MCR1860227.1 IS630 family transposase [Phocaeicola vulgatus]QQY40645.1 IS630 family transposase [Phocaeicola vulgatus]QQY41026.1 IS630 family transposase [Phocaeicola vulgatus]QQY42364.1 IS630 family transposase [Phocaeicola vulgatus]
MLTLKLSEEEFQRLKYEKEMNKSSRVRKRCSAIYMKQSCPSLSCQCIAQLLCCHRTSVEKWIHTCLSEGLTALLHTNPYRPKSELDNYKNAIMSSLNEHPVHSVPEAAERISQVCGLFRKPTQVRAFLIRNGYKYRKMGQVPGKADLEQQKRWLDKLRPVIAASSEGRCRLLFSDAVHFTLSAFPCMAWSLKRLFLKTSSGRNRINVLGAVDALTKEVVTMDNTTYITADTVVDFLHLIRKTDAEKTIYIVMDNARYQHCKLVTEEAEKLNIRILFLPPYSPNLNIIERLWKFTKKKVLYGKYYDSVNRFHTAIRNFFDNVNMTYREELDNLLSLNFQTFKNENDVFVTA